LGFGFLRHGLRSDPRGHRAHVTWSERQDMRVNVESRQPLYPACRNGKTPTDDVIVGDQHVSVVRASDAADALAAVEARLTYEREHPDQFYFTRARVFTTPHAHDRGKELLMVLYEADDDVKYLESFTKAAATDADYQTAIAEVDRFVLDDPETRVTTWTELQELRVQYESREPLYPAPDAEQTPGQRDVLDRGRGNGARSREGKPISALVENAALGIENVLAALQTRDPALVSESVTRGVQRMKNAVSARGRHVER
jgi:hypothetical protein